MARVKVGYLIDTDILITHLRKPELVNAALLKISQGDSGNISIITRAELFAGKSTQDQQIIKKIEQLLSLFSTLLVTEDVARMAGQIRRDYDLTLTDALIAATAIENDLSLLTFNLKDFQKVPKLTIVDISQLIKEKAPS